MKKTVAYYRSSTDLQENSVTTQQHQALKYCMNNYLFLDDEYEDEYVSAKKKTIEQRKDLSRLLEDIKNDKIENLIVYKRDRLARKVEDHMLIYYLLKEKNVKVHFTSNTEYPMKYNNFAEILELMLGGMSEHEGKQINERILTTRIANFEKGMTLDKLPYGFMAVGNNEIAENEDEIKLVKFIFDEVCSGRHYSLNHLRKYMIELNYTRRGKEWKTVQIEDVIKEPMYKGMRVRTYGGQNYFREVNEHAIFKGEDSVIWDNAQDILEKMKPQRDLDNETKVEFALEDGLVCCGICHQKLEQKIRMRKGKYVGYYECKHDSVAVASDWIENRIFDKAQDFFAELMKTNLNSIFKRYWESNNKRFDKKIKDQETLIELNDKRLGRIVSKYLKIDKNVPQAISLREKMEKLKVELEINREMHSALLIEKEKSCGYPTNELKVKSNTDFFSNISDLTNDKKKEMISDIVYRIDVERYSYGVIFKHPFLELRESFDEDN
ncbi:recombinase family protein [Paenibacillus odorifer]|uniref:Recombinase family protein n=1 Tax=Paenibacillus odorifer TaxID=189426 RepID=A0A1R0Y062_9BACL|nr:recombinase family protein [Paenibacillus odorifer]OMD40702.1 hypothetical protein BSK52_12595 [Paenibacillus odorifer]